MKRCSWIENIHNDVYIKYHDEEWGKPCFDDHYLFETLILECFHTGLSWECVLMKRDHFREAFDNFDAYKIVNYDESKIIELIHNPGIIRHQKKIEAAITNAKVYLEIVNEFESFSNYIWHFTNHQVIYETNKTSSLLSDTVCKDLKKRGMKFVGSVTIYSYLQAIGVINSHEEGCVFK